ncbi:hypothetical protein PMIN01_01321 [Paraphaeosphaeria minitans]|uniref:Heterokaryon incompatibility domain-containing protein n=1 Tax=Paraphaeosphaeria minitans TaxID=565426 RepID=A0A9P6GTX5_9PLEO|nr:hypothetical protein PMIN01_01321 [Paraphaeosphaeria minitans]
MGFFSKSKKGVTTPSDTNSAPKPKPVKPGLIESFVLKRHNTGVLRYGTKDENGWPIASRMYWNTIPTTPCPQVQQNSVFDVDDKDTECYDKRELLSGRTKVTHVFNVEHNPQKANPNAVRPVGVYPDYKLIRSWLGQCEKEHSQCRVHGNAEKLVLITLIDVRTRRLVQYQPGMQYMALSYVWGTGIPIPKRIRPREFPINVCKTIQHAMVVTGNIGLSYLWADAVCTDQHDPQDKIQQIPLMAYIYERAFATIVALGDHANVGLPGVDGGPQRRRQLVAEFGPVRMVSRCPTLSSQINESLWSTRGWTYQEGLLSRRCIFFSEHQVYFHCNSMLCTEDSPSSAHVSEAKDLRTTVHQTSYWNADKMHIRRNTLWTSPMAGDIFTYIAYLEQYVCRDVSHDSDAVNAFGAVLSRMERDFFRRGFLYGIPRDAFSEGLLWVAAAPLSPRIPGKVQINFPSWSWAGWKTGESAISYAPAHTGYGNEHTIVTFPLSISFGKECLYRSESSNVQLSGIGLEIRTLWDAYSRSQKHSPPRTDLRSPASNALHIDGPIMTLPVTYDAQTQLIGFEAPSHLSKVDMVRLGPMPNEKRRDDFHLNESLPVPKGKPVFRDFLVMRTKYAPKYVVYEEIELTLMMLAWTGTSVATRAGILRLNITANLGGFWEFANVRRNEFWLI